MKRGFIAFTLNYNRKYTLVRYGTFTLNKTVLLSFEEVKLIPEKQNLYKCSFDFPLKGVLVNPEDNKKTINSKVNLEDTTNNIDFYAHLTLLQKFYVRYYLDKFWIQKSGNLLWIINLLIALIAAIGAWKFGRSNRF